MSSRSLPSVGYMTRTTEVKLQVSLDTLDTLLRYHYAKLSMSFVSPLPLDVEEYVNYCKSIVAYKTALADQNPVPSKSAEGKDDNITRLDSKVRTSLRSCVLPCFLENFVSRIGVYDDVETGVKILWKRLDMDVMDGTQLGEKSLQLAAVRSQNVDLAFNAVSLSPVSDLDNAYITDNGYVYSLSGTDVKGYQMAAALEVTPVSFGTEILFRKLLSTVHHAKQEVVNGFGHTA